MTSIVKISLFDLAFIFESITRLLLEFYSWDYFSPYNDLHMKGILLYYSFPTTRHFGVLKEENLMVKKNSGNNTKCVHAGTYLDDRSYGVNTPIFASTAHIYPNEKDLVRYPRYGNIPTQKAVIDKLIALEYGESGQIFSSGMAAITTTIFALLRSGDHAIFQSGLYGGTQKFINSELEKYGVEKNFVQSNRISDYEKNIKENTKLFYVESPTNPLLDIIDLKALAELARENSIITIIDNTFATPINQNPLNLGIDIAVHSGTKYLNGHSDLCCGAVVTSKELMEPIQDIALNHGGCLDAISCYLLERGLKTLGLRIERQNKNAQRLAEFLNGHDRVERIFYPGLSQHPGFEIAKRQMRGFGGMLSFELKGDYEKATKFTNNLELIMPAVSLGGVETICCFPAKTSHAKISAEERKAQGIADSLIRLSVGIEDIDDLVEDINNALLKTK
jgi:cystathionine beta-lyase